MKNEQPRGRATRFQIFSKRKNLSSHRKFFIHAPFQTAFLQALHYFKRGKPRGFTPARCDKIKHRGFIILAMTFIFLFAVLQNAVSQMPYGWRCLKCGSSTMSVNKPLLGACIKGGGHNWQQ